MNFENGITTVGGYAFRNCSRLQKVTLPSSLQSIKQSAFNHCAELTSIEIPEGTETIDGFAFTGCEALADVTIPESMKTIKRYAFRGCNKLRKVKTNSDCILRWNLSRGFSAKHNVSENSVQNICRAVSPQRMRIIGSMVFFYL